MPRGAPPQERFAKHDSAAGQRTHVDGIASKLCATLFRPPFGKVIVRQIVTYIGVT